MAKILIVEDDNSIAQSYMMQLVKTHNVQVAPDAMTGLQLAADRPDIILLDMLMPGYSGLDFLRELDARKNLPQTKIIAISNAESPKIIEQAKLLGVSQYLLKVNFTPSQIETIIGQLLGESTS